MTKILIANQDIAEINKIDSYFNNNVNFKIYTTNYGLSALEQYNKVNPDIFILATNLKDISYNEILKKISSNINEKFNCNIILLSDSPDEILHLANISKLYDFYIKPYDYKSLFNTMEEMSKNNLDKKIDLLFLKTRIPLGSPASDRVRETISKRYHSPRLLGNLNQVFALVANDFKTTNEGIRSSFRTTLKPLNVIKDNINAPNFAIFNLFPKGEDLTPKNFLDISTFYLHNVKK